MKKHGLIPGLMMLVLGLFALPMSYADAPIDAREGRAEMRFLEGMIDHHQMALDMAADCLARAAAASVVTLCQNIITAQSAEIETMQGWLLHWYNIEYTPMPMMDMMGMMGMDMRGGTHGGRHMTEGPFIDPPMSMGMFAGFNQVEGVEYEIAWLEAMIDHHDDALHMAQRLLTRVPQGAGHSDLYELAQQIIANQTAEIDLMEALIFELAR